MLRHRDCGVSRMKFRVRIRLATDNMVWHPGELLGSILLCILSLLLTAVLFLLSDMNANRREQLERCFRMESSQIGYIKNFSENELDDEKYLELVRSIDGIAPVAVYDTSHLWTVDFVSDLAEFQRGHKPRGEFNMPGIEGGLDIFEVNAAGWSMLDLELYQGIGLDEFREQYDMKEYVPVYLGYEYRRIVEAGTVLGTDYMGITYIIAGILKPGMRMPKDLDNLNETDAAFAYPMDYGVLKVEPDFGLSTHMLTIFAEEGVSFQEVQERIQTAAEEAGIFVEIASLEAIFDSYDRMQRPVNRYMLQMVLVVGLTVCILFTCYQTISIITRRSEYGILYANGATTRDLVAIILIENLVKLLIALIIMIPVFLLLVQKAYAFWSLDQSVISQLFWSRIIWKILSAGLGMVLLSSLLPVYTLTHYTPVSLIGGEQR